MKPAQIECWSNEKISHNQAETMQISKTVENHVLTCTYVAAIAFKFISCATQCAQKFPHHLTRKIKWAPIRFKQVHFPLQS